MIADRSHVHASPGRCSTSPSAAYMVFLAFPLLFLLVDRVQDAAGAGLGRPDVPARTGSTGRTSREAIDKTRLFTTARNSLLVAIGDDADHDRHLAAGGLRPGPLPQPCCVASRRGGSCSARSSRSSSSSSRCSSSSATCSSCGGTRPHRPVRRPHRRVHGVVAAVRAVDAARLHRRHPRRPRGGRQRSTAPRRLRVLRQRSSCRCSRPASSPPRCSRSSRRGTSSSSPSC